MVELEFDAPLEAGTVVSIYKTDKSIVTINVIDADTSRIEGYVLVVDGKKADKIVTEIERNQIEKIVQRQGVGVMAPCTHDACESNYGANNAVNCSSFACQLFTWIGAIGLLALIGSAI